MDITAKSTKAFAAFAISILTAECALIKMSNIKMAGNGKLEEYIFIVLALVQVSRTISLRLKLTMYQTI